MGKRDDMVLVVDLGPETKGVDGASAPTRAEEERRAVQAKGRRGVVGKVVKYKAARRAGNAVGGIGKRALGKMLGFAGFNVARMGATAAVGAAAGSAGLATGGAALAAGGIITAVVIAGMVALRLASGKSFEGMGQVVNNILLGDADDSARAHKTVRDKFASTPHIALSYKASGEMTPAMRSLFDSLVDIETRKEQGRSKALTVLDVPGASIFDQLILRARDAFQKAWNGSDGPAKVQGLANKLGGWTSGGLAAYPHGPKGGR